MYHKYISLYITFVILNGCGGGDSSTPINTSRNKSNFTYKTQRTVDVSISTPETINLTQRQILLFETQNSLVEKNTPGEILTFKSLLVEGNTDDSNGYKNNLTLGSHIESIWVVIPSLAYEKKIKIVNNKIVLNIIEKF